MSDPFVSRDVLLSMSGLDFMRGMIAGTVPHPAIGETMNFRVSTLEPHSVTFTGTPLVQHTNPMGTAHGGWYGAILDSAMGCAVMTTVPKGSVYTTLEYKVNITRSIPLGMRVQATGTVEHAGRSTGVATGLLKGVEDGKVYATGSTTCIIMAMDTP